MKLALVVPHIFFHQDILPQVIFSPGELVLCLAKNLAELGHEVTVFSPGSVSRLLGGPTSSTVNNITADLTLFEQELALRKDNYLDLLKKHPLTFISLARQVQTELVAQAYELANQGQFDLVHIWCNEEEQALAMARFCDKPVLFNHHEPFNFLARYRAIFPKYPQLNWLSFSLAQRQTFGLPEEKVNWVGNVYHGLEPDLYQFNSQPDDYLLYAGRIIQPKGVHYAIATAKKLEVKLKIAGKHYADHNKDRYWQEFILPQIDGEQVEYLGFVKDQAKKQQLFSQAKVLLMPSTWQEPFGLVMVEALACGTPIIGFGQGAIPEVIENGVNGWVVSYQGELGQEQNSRPSKNSLPQLQRSKPFQQNVAGIVEAVKKLNKIDRLKCRKTFEQRFTAKKMAADYQAVYHSVLNEGE